MTGATGPVSLGPVGGLTHQVLHKLSDADLDTGWRFHLPVGGTTREPLVKNSDADMDVGWLNGRHLKIGVDGFGVEFAAGGMIYKPVSRSIVIREPSSGQQPQIEDNNGSNPRDIIDTINGDARYALHLPHPSRRVRPASLGGRQRGVLQPVGRRQIHPLQQPTIMWMMHVTSLQGIAENAWFPLIAGDDYPDWMWPWITDRRSRCRWRGTTPTPDQSASSVRIQTDGWVHCYKGGGGGDLQSNSLVTIDHVYPRG